MSNLSVTEFQMLGRDLHGSPLPAGYAPPLTIQNVTFTATAGTSAAFAADTKFIRVVTDFDARIVFGESPTATSSDMLMAAGQAEYFGVKPGDKISAIEVV